MTEVEFTITRERVRIAVKEVSGREITSEQAGMMMQVFGEELATDLTNAFREFLAKHFGRRAEIAK